MLISTYIPLAASHLSRTKSTIFPIDLKLCLHQIIISDLAPHLISHHLLQSPPSLPFVPEALSLLFSHSKPWTNPQILDNPSKESSACCFPYLEFHLPGIQVHFLASFRYWFQCYLCSEDFLLCFI